MILNRQTHLHFFPERIAWIGLGILSTGVLLALPFLYMLQASDSIAFLRKDVKERVDGGAVQSFSLGLIEKTPGFSIPDLQGKMTFSFDSPRPCGVDVEKRLLVRLKHAGESKRVTLPCRLDLEYQGDQLRFSKDHSLFWMDLSELPNGQIDARGWIASSDGTTIDAGHFQIAGQEAPLQKPNEFVEGSAFRVLADGKWWGKDLFRPAGESGERIEIVDLIECRIGDWLVWKEGKWQKGELEADIPIARIQSISPKMLVLEGWDNDGHTRIGLNLAAPPPFKIKAEDLLSSIRVRSEKQISCMLEKQCMVLKTGDWILKKEGRWKVLRKKDEREAFLNGKLFGELFILEQISQKQGQKMIQGRFFNSGRTQVVQIEMPASGGKKLKNGRIP